MSIWVVMLLGCEPKDAGDPSVPEPEEEEETTTPEPEPDDDCVVQELGPDGGIISAEGVSVTILPDVLDEESEVELCPVETVSGYTLHSGAWELLGVELSAPAELVLAHDGADGLALFVPGADGLPQRSLEQQEGEGELVGPLYRGGVFFVAEDARLQVTYQATGSVDLLFVVDNSCSMADDQQRLADAFPQAFDLLQNLDYDPVAQTVLIEADLEPGDVIWLLYLPSVP
jgi:hypothetical protein